MYAKCLIVPILVAFIIVMLILQRKKTNQVLLAVMLATLIGGAYRLYYLQTSGESDDQTMLTVAIILGADGGVLGDSLGEQSDRGAEASAETPGAVVPAPRSDTRAGGGNPGPR